MEIYSYWQWAVHLLDPKVWNKIACEQSPGCYVYIHDKEVTGPVGMT